MWTFSSSELCLGSSLYSDPESVSINTVEVSVQKKSVFEDFSDKMIVNAPNGTDADNALNSVIK
jgi:hypothetical protein